MIDQEKRQFIFYDSEQSRWILFFRESFEDSSYDYELRINKDLKPFDCEFNRYYKFAGEDEETQVVIMQSIAQRFKINFIK